MYQNRLRPPQTKPKQVTTPKGLFMFAALLVATLVLAGGFFLLRGKTEEKPPAKSTPQAPSFDKTRHSLTDPASPWVVVNKKRPLSPKSYVPPTLKAPAMRLAAQATHPSMHVNSEAADALTKMDEAARTQNINLLVVSAYRSYDLQVTIYNSEVAGYGQAQADRESARPGHSEHQSGWAVDLGAVHGKCKIEACFADTTEGKWLAQNAYKYGFIIRYTADKEPVTGYNYEPWHFRYVGVDLATEMHAKKIQTLEEFFGLPAAPSY